MVLILNLLGILIFGFLLVNILYKQSYVSEKLSIGFLFGLGLTTFILFYLNWYGMKLTGSNISRTIFLLVTGVTMSNLLLKSFDLRNEFRKVKSEVRGLFSKKINLLFLTVILYLFISATLANFYWPVRDWDALTLYDFRAKVFAETGFMKDVFEIHRYYLAYPLFTSMAHTIVYLSGFSNPSFLYSFIYLAFLVIFGSILTRVTRSVTYSLFFSTLMASTSIIYQQSQITYTNLPYAIFLVLTFLYLYLWLDKNNIGLFLVSIFFASLSTWIRHSDPFWITALPAILIFASKGKKLFFFVIFLISVLFIRYSWSMYAEIQSSIFPIKTSLDLSLLYQINIEKLINQFFEVVIYFWQYVLKPQSIVLLIYIFMIFVDWNKSDLLSKYSRYIVLANLVLVFGGIYAISFVYSKWQLVGDSVSRMSLFLTPLILFLAANALFNYFNDERRVK